MEQLFRETLAKFEEVVIEIEKTKERRFSMAHRRWPEIAPMEEQREMLRESLVRIAMVQKERWDVIGLCTCERSFHQSIVSFASDD